MHPLDRPLLIGLVALEQELVTPGELIDAFRQWRQHPESSLGHILASKGKLSPDRIDSLERFVADSSLVSAVDGVPISANPPTTTWRFESTSLAGSDEPTTSLHKLRAEAPAKPAYAPLVRRGAPDRFRPVSLHARGGLGQVYLAEDLELNRRVALKEIKPNAAHDSWSRHRFVAEAEITGNLEHPGIVPVYGLGVYPDGRPFYAMRFIEGETLTVAIARFHRSEKPDFGSLEFRQLLSRLVSVCNAVAFAHSRGIVHRDLKPPNVMLGPFGETLVVDWGLAKALHQPEDGPDQQCLSSSMLAVDGHDREWATSDGEVVGTPAYMSPEQARGEIDKISPASDVYSLGATLYALLAGQSPPRVASTSSGVNIEPDPAAQREHFKPKTPRPLVAICRQAMAPLAKHRYASALEMAADIERWLADEPALADEEPWTDRAFRWMRKNRLPVAVVGALLLATSLALAIGYVLVSKERDIAEVERSKAVAATSLAQQNAAATRDVVEQFLIQVGDDRWSQIPGFEEIRLKMVSLAVNRYGQLLLQQPQDASLAADAAVAFRRCANLYRMVGRYRQAAPLYEDAIQRLTQAAKRDPSNNTYDARLCETLCDRAELILRLSGPKAAEGPMREALAIGQRLRERQPTSMAARLVEARVQMNLADILRDEGQISDATKLAQAAASTFQQAASRSSVEPIRQLMEVFSGMVLADILRDADQRPEAVALLDQTIQKAGDYVTSKPQDPNLRYVLAWSRFQRTLAQPAEPDSPDSQHRALAEATVDLEQLVREFPMTSSFRRRLAEALTAQARTALGGDAHQFAAETVGRAIDILTQLDREEDSPAIFQPLLGAAYAVAGEIEMARDDASAARLKLQEAQRRLEQSAELNPNSRRLTEDVGRVKSMLASLGC